MRGFFAFFKKEILQGIRDGKLFIIGILFLGFGIMNPAIAKLTPWLFDMFSETLAESGMIIGSVSVDALTSWTQFFKNIPMALIAFLIIYSGIFTSEYQSGTLILMLTKGFPRYKVVLTKTLYLLLSWSAGYWLCFGVTYIYNDYFWDNGIATGLLDATLMWYLFGTLCVCLTVLFSVIFRTYTGVLLGTGASVLASYLVGFIPKLKKLSPTSLMSSAQILVGTENAQDYLGAIIITSALCLLCVIISLFSINKKQL